MLVRQGAVNATILDVLLVVLLEGLPDVDEAKALALVPAVALVLKILLDGKGRVVEFVDLDHAISAFYSIIEHIQNTLAIFWADLLAQKFLQRAVENRLWQRAVYATVLGVLLVVPVENLLDVLPNLFILGVFVSGRLERVCGGNVDRRFDRLLHRRTRRTRSALHNLFLVAIVGDLFELGV